jgi:glycosyltransferase involved in cell wall biosynthesis
MFAYASSIVAVSKAMQQRLVEIGCPPEKIVYNPYGPDDLFFEITPEYTGKKFIAIGRFVDKKAPYYTILAFHQVLQRHPDAQLVIGGDGPLHNTCKNLVAWLGMQAQVQLPGVLTPDEYRAHLKNSIAFVQHSITAANGDMEGTPVAVLEASAAGLPVISTRHAGIPDVILHQQTGLLVEEHDVDGMAHWMNWVLENPGESREMGERGKRRVRGEFSLEQHLSKLHEIIMQSAGHDG